MTRSQTKFALLVLTFVFSASLALADRPEAGQGGIFADDMQALNFQWVDFDGDFLQVFWAPGSADDFARETPNGKRYVHAVDENVDMVAVVGGILYSGSGTYQTSYFANCNVFAPSVPAFNCFIGPGPASMNAHGTVTNQVTGAECTLSGHLAAFFVNERACEAFGVPAPSCVGGQLFAANSRQFDIKVTCGN